MSGWNNLLPISAKLGGKFVEVFGGMFAQSLRGHSSLRTDQRATGIYRTIDPQRFRTSMLATTRILVSRLATARVFCFPPTTPNCLMAPTLLAGIYRCQRSQATRAATPPQRLRQWNHGRSLIDGIVCLDGFGFPLYLYSSDFRCLILVIISMYLFGFGKIGYQALFPVP